MLDHPFWSRVAALFAAIAICCLGGCTLEGRHDLSTVQPRVFPLDLNELNTYVSSDDLLTITRSQEGYAWVSWARPQYNKKALPFDLFDTSDRKGWLGQSPTREDGKVTYTYFHLEKQPSRLVLLHSPDKKIVESTPDLRGTIDFGERELVARNAQDALTLLQRYVRLKALTGFTFDAPQVAIDDATAALGLKPDNVSALKKRSLGWLAKGDPARAVSDLSSAMRNANSPDDVSDLYYRRGLAHRAARALDLAVGDFTTAIARERDAASRREGRSEPTKLLRNALFARALTWKQAGELDRAIAGFGEAITADAEANDAYHHRGLARQSRGDLQGAIADFSEALRIMPSDALTQAALKAGQTLATARPATAPVGLQPVGGQRVALVIGNASYQNEATLNNPANDARLIDKTLRTAPLSFSHVTHVSNANRVQLLSALSAFKRQAQGADVALVYYSGHGMINSKRQNHVLPVDMPKISANAGLDADTALEAYGVSEDKLIDAISGAKVQVAVLDACRDNGFGASKSGTKGLSPRADESKKRLIAYATEEGRTAEDGKAGNSTYAASLAKHLVRTDWPLLKVFDEVASDVERGTGGQQSPTRSGNLRTDVYLLGSRPAKSD